ncbi:hypothetical protein [Mucilaginibacter sp. PAMB04168]|uniref:hypothetical protein n=1 Tax=Mucilaginibacter sp. PAMB04168 TaxID=3138567 RepID=UPI0031F6FCA0
MKTSNKILLAAVLIVVAYTVGYDFALKAEYDKGAYKNKFYRMTEFKVSNFDSISHNTTNIAGVKIEQGDKYGVWVDDNMKDQVKIEQQGTTLNINCDTTKDLRRRPYYASIVITCPKLKGLSTHQLKTAHDEDNANGDGRIEIIGLNQTVPLSITADKGVDILLSKNKLGMLNVNLGTAKDRAELFIYNSNSIQVANLQLKGRSQLNLDNPTIVKGNYHFGDSTMVTLSGQALKLVPQQ